MLRSPVLLMLSLSCSLMLAACHGTPSAHEAGKDADRGPESVGIALNRIDKRVTEHQYVKLSYPVVTGPEGRRLNPVIGKWIGARCPVPGEKSTIYSDPAACAAAFTKACAGLKKQYGKQVTHFGCTLDAQATVKLDAAGLLGVIYKTYAYTGGAHGNTVVSYLNLDLASGQVLKLDDLLDKPDRVRLAAQLQAAVRKKRHIPPSRSLKQAGFFVVPFPPTDTVLALPQGLLFTYQSYDVGPYVLGQPHAVVPYGELQDVIARNGPLPRLEALGKQLAAMN